MVAALVAALSTDSAEEGRPARLGMTETTDVSLMVLDIEVFDREGRPVRGLTRADFSARLDGRSWQIYSVDDLCDCATPAPVPSGDRASRIAEASSSPAAVGEAIRFVLYFDFSQLQQGGRITAMKEAKRWIQVTMRASDEVMIASFATASGLRTLTEFTRDRATLLAAVDKAFNDPAQMDPFPTQLSSRIDDCRRGRSSCYILAMDEYEHGRRSLTALNRFLIGLEQVPGRKSLIFFHENGNIFPGSMYGQPRTSDHARRLEEIGAEATSSRVVVFPASTGDGNLLGPDLAGFTGGRYNDSQGGLSFLIDDARNRCACVYRVALTPPDFRKRRVHQVSIAVAGRELPSSYRVQSLTRADRWLRSAQAVLARPESARDLLVTAGLVPLRAQKGRWDLKVQVALQMDSLTMLPSEGGRTGLWEIGGVLVQDGGKQSWEMLGVSEVHRTEEGAGDTWVVHERTFYGLPKGNYHVAAFVRDRRASVFGGAEASLDLPKPRSDGVAGPILMRSARRQIVSTLPLLRGRKPEPAHNARIVVGPLPAGSRPLEGTEPLEAMSWICPKKADGPAADLPRYLSRAEVPLLRFDQASTSTAGDCLLITDRIEHWRPEGGFHSYHLRWISQNGSEVARAEVPFEVAGPVKAARTP